MTEVEQPPQNGIDPTAGEDDENSKARPADIEQDMREMERRKRVEAIMGSKLFREELERIVDSAREGGAGACGILQQLSDIVGVPINRVSNVFKSSGCMVPINDIRGVESMGYAKGEKILRCKLAATFRLLDLYGWTQGLGAQITARLKVDQEYFLVNPYGLMFHEITASSLNKVDMQGQIVEQGTTNFGVNKSHFVLHSVVHAARPDIRCAIYIGFSPVVAISSLKTGLLPLTKDACMLGEISSHAYTGLFDEDERDRLVRNLGPNSKVILLANHGALCCGETIEEAFFAACHIVQACETQLKLLPVGLDNLVTIPEESRKLIYDQSRRPPEDLEKKFAAITADEDGAAAGKEEPTPKIGSPPKWRVGGAEFEALMRMLDNAGYRTGYIYRHPLIKSDPPKPKNDVELPPAVSSLGYLLEEEELFRQGIWKKGDLRKGGDRSRWLNSPNVYQKVEVLETGTPDPKKITKWVAEGSPTHSTPVRIEDPLQFVPAGTTTKEFKRVQQQIKDNRRADKISAGPQSHILEGVTWDEANRIKDATVSQTGDHVVLMGAASKGIIQRGFQHNATVYKAPYAKNPFDNVTDDELNEYKRTVERKKKSIHGEYTDTDFSESEALNSMQAAGAQAHAKHAQSEPETEHQVIQIQTQQAPIPSQAEVVLSDATLSFINGERSHTASNRKPPTGRDFQDQDIEPDAANIPRGGERNNNLLYDEVDKENQVGVHAGVPLGTRKCRRDLLDAFSMTNSVPKSYPDSHRYAQHVAGLGHKHESRDFYSYAYGAAVLGRCCQPQICSVLLQALHSEHLQNVGYCRGNRSSPPSSITGTSHTNEPSTPRRPLQSANDNPRPYRTVSHFGFNSPRQPPRMEHKHLPATAESLRYRPVQRDISYEEIFATPRYEQLCHFCFEQLLRLKPELQKRSAASSSVGEEPEELPSCSAHGQERNVSCHIGTQTITTFASNKFLTQIERMNFTDESTNPNYVPGLQTVNSDLSSRDVATPSSPAASATSAPPNGDAGATINPDAPEKMKTNLTEVWNFGNWQEQAQEQAESAQQPLTEHRITLELTQHFNGAEQALDVQQPERQLMPRDERHRRKLEFEELWQDHVQYFSAKERTQQEESQAVEPALTMSLDAEEAQSLSCNGCPGQPQEGHINADPEEPCADEIRQSNGQEEVMAPPEVAVKQHAVVEIPKILKQFKQSLSIAGENLKILVSTTKNLQAADSSEDSMGEWDDPAPSRPLFRAISVENIPEADETALVSEPRRVDSPNSSCIDRGESEQGEEKRDDEKPVTPIPASLEVSEKVKDCAEYRHVDEKDIDENEHGLAVADRRNPSEATFSGEQTAAAAEREASAQRDSDAVVDEDEFTPIERYILDRIEAGKLKESEPIFARIEESIRNKLTPAKLQRIISGTEEIFHTRTHIYTSPPPPTPHKLQSGSEPRPSNFSVHNINAPASSSAHVRVIAGKAPRVPRSWDKSYNESKESSSTSSLERTLSSTTFVFRSSPRKKRNFIKENIRNASRPRTLAKSCIISRARNRGQLKASDLSSVCTFQAEERDSSARLWVSLPTTPRLNQNHKSASPTNVYSPIPRSGASPSSNPGSKIRKIAGTQPGKMTHNLHKTVSSGTFFMEASDREEGALVKSISSTTYEVEVLSDDQLSETFTTHSGPLLGKSSGKRTNETSSSFYFSADDITATEGKDFVSLGIVQGSSAAGRTKSRQEQEMNEQMQGQEHQDELQIGESERNEPREELGAAGGVDRTTEDPSKSMNVTDSKLSKPKDASTDEDIKRAQKKGKETQGENQKSHEGGVPSSQNLTRSTEIVVSALVAEQIEQIIFEELNAYRQSDDDNLDASSSADGTSGYLLSPKCANIDIKQNFRPGGKLFDSDSSSDNGEYMLKADYGLLQSQSSHQDTSEDDDKPNTSAAAAIKRMRKYGGSTTKAAEPPRDEQLTLATTCTLKDGTLQVTQDLSEEVQRPRCVNGDITRAPVYHLFNERDEWDLFERDEGEVDVEMDEESETDSESFHPIGTADTLSITHDENSEFSLEMQLPLGAYDQLELELDTRMLVGSDLELFEDTEYEIEWPSVNGGRYTFGSLVVELSEEQPEDRSEPESELPNTNSVQTLEITQNEMNQSMAQEQEQHEPEGPQPPE